MVTGYRNMNPAKVLEALVWVAHNNPGADFHNILKTIFYADKCHLQKYGRPVVGDHYKKMDYGPVGSCAYDLLKKSSFCTSGMAAAAKNALDIRQAALPRVYPLRDPNLDFFSDTDIECLQEALAFCQDKTFGQLCDLTHKEPAWQEAFENEDLNYELLVGDASGHEEIVKTIRETAPSLVF